MIRSFLCVYIYLGLILQKRKFKRFAKFLKVPFYLVIWFEDDKWGMIDLVPHADQLLRVEWGGRTDRNDPADMEPMVRLDIKWFMIHDFVKTAAKPAEDLF